MDYLLNVLILFQAVYFCDAGECQIEHCRHCTSSQACSVCESGRFGQKCEYECRADSSTCFLCKDSFLKAFASISEAECFGCQNQEYVLKGECLHCPPTCVSCVDANNCSECYDGYFGLNCSDVCPENCQQCSSQDLCTSCKDSWSGGICQCSSDCLLEGQQPDWCSVNGTCLKGCVRGKRGIRCDVDCPKEEICLKCDQFAERCLQCSDGLYGSLGYCDKTCGHCKPNNEGFIKCDVDTGECNDACVDGYFGGRCDQKCAHCLPDEIGVVKCDNDTGNCRNDCVDGFYGSQCDNKCGQCLPDNRNVVKCDKGSGKCRDACVDGYFGSRCDKKCGDCLSNVTDMVNCDNETGECIVACMDGFYGRFCNQECGENCFDPSTNSRKCDEITGNCTFGCVQGWYGNICELTCNVNCLNTSCNQSSGKCRHGCVLGWYGDTCKASCSNTCLNGTCNDVSGFCINGCLLGWYGTTCNITCNSMCLNRSCDQQLGHCDYGCVSGFYGDTCEYRCSDNCEKGICDRQTSQCSSGCETGFEGPFCNVTQTSEAHLSPVLIGVISGFAAFVALLGCVLFIWFILRKAVCGKQYCDLRSSMTENAVPVYNEIDDNMVEMSFDRDNFDLLQETQHSGSRLYVSGIYDLPVERDSTTSDKTVLARNPDNTNSQLKLPIVNVHNHVRKTNTSDDYYEVPLTTKLSDTGTSANLSNVCCDISNVCCGNENLSSCNALNLSESPFIKTIHRSEHQHVPYSNEYMEFGHTENTKADRKTNSGNCKNVALAECLSTINKNSEMSSSLSEENLNKMRLQEATHLITERASCNYIHPIS